MNDDKKPFSVRLGELRPVLEKEAQTAERSLHWWIKKILKDYITKKQKTKI